jgi:hypothetical protein
MVTFTIPEELRQLFFGEGRKESFELFFKATWQALSTKLADPPSGIRDGRRVRGPGFALSGATAVLHTWNQKLLFHPHIHFIVPGAGLDDKGRVVTLSDGKFLVRVEALAGAFKAAFREGMKSHGWQCDPIVWNKQWGVHIQACGSGAAALKYLGRYVGCGPIGNGRILNLTEESVTFSWKDRSNGGAQGVLPIPGVEFVRRYLRHILPKGLRAIRYFGWCHPAAKKKRERIKLQTGMPLEIKTREDDGPAPMREDDPRRCPECKTLMERTELSREFVLSEQRKHAKKMATGPP